LCSFSYYSLSLSLSTRDFYILRKNASSTSRILTFNHLVYMSEKNKLVHRITWCLKNRNKQQTSEVYFRKELHFYFSCILNKRTWWPPSLHTELSLMSSNFLTQALTTEVFFRNANGIQLTLEEKASSNLSNANIINFVLRSEKHFNVNLCLTSVCVILLIWIVLGALVSLIVSACILILQCKSFITSIKQGKF